MELPRLRSVAEVGSDSIHPPPFRRFVGDLQPLCDYRPTVGGRQRRGEACFVEVAQINRSQFPFFSAPPTPLSWRPPLPASACASDVGGSAYRRGPPPAAGGPLGPPSAARRAPRQSSRRFAAPSRCAPLDAVALSRSPKIAGLSADCCPRCGASGSASNPPARNRFTQ